MNRKVIALDRVVALVVGLVLIAAGAAGALWWLGTFPSWPQTLAASWVAQWPTATWWPWATGAAGVVLILLGLRWLAGHLPDRGVTHVTLPGSDERGRLSAQVRSVAKTAADVLATTPGVRSASGSVQRERGQLLVKFDATIEPQADLEVIAAAADRVTAELRTVLQREDLRGQVDLKVARRARAMPRVD